MEAEILNESLNIIKQNKNKPILVYFDPDVDGLFAGLFVCRWLQSLDLKFSYFVNTKRKHGFTIPAEALKGYLVIAVDFAITREEMQNLVDNDINIVSIDHHGVEDNLIKVSSNTARGIVLNNQYPFEPEDDRYLSGAGVVYEVICKWCPQFECAEHRALVGITLLSDARVIEGDKARKYLRSAFNMDIQEGTYLEYLIKNTIEYDFGFGCPKMDRNYIDYTFSPRINRLFRFGKEAEVLKFILGIDSNLPNLRKKQSEVVEEMKKIMYKVEYSDLIVCCVVAQEFAIPNVDVTNFIGLLCSNVKGTGRSTLAFVLDNGVVTRASFRGRYDDVDYKGALRSIGIDAEGHDNAFGIKNFRYTDDTWNEINTVINKIDKGHKSTIKVKEVSNLQFFLTNGYKVAENNNYCRDLYKTYLKYVGNNISVGRLKKATFKENGSIDKKAYIEYIVDGNRVKSFDEKLTPQNGFILPTLEKGYVQLYLREVID